MAKRKNYDDEFMFQARDSDDDTPEVDGAQLDSDMKFVFREIRNVDEAFGREMHYMWIAPCIFDWLRSYGWNWRAGYGDSLLMSVPRTMLSNLFMDRLQRV